jgi:predicted ATPase
LSLEILQGTAYRAVKGFASSDVERSFTRAHELCERLGDDRARIDVLRGLFSCYYARGALASARQLGEQVTSLGQKLNDSNSRMLGHWMLGCVTFWQGEYPTARRELEEAFSLYDPEEHRTKTLALQIDPGVNALFHLSCALWILGYPDQAVRTGDKAIHIARQLAQPVALAMALFFACRTRACCGHDEWVRRHLQELTDTTAKHGLGYLRSCARVLEAQALLEQNRCVACLEQIERAFSEFRSQEAGVALTWAMSMSASAYARLGRLEEGIAVIAEAFEAADRNGEHHWDAELWRLKGELLLLASARGESEAEASFRRAIDVARGQQAKSLELRASMSLARLLDRQDKTELARRTLGQVCDWFTEGFDTIDLRDARSALKLSARGQQQNMRGGDPSGE